MARAWLSLLGAAAAVSGNNDCTLLQDFAFKCPNDSCDIGSAPGANAADCCEQCYSKTWKDKGCVAFGYAGNATCWFKNKTPAPMSSHGVISGKCTLPTPAPTPLPPTPLPTPPLPTPPPPPTPVPPLAGSKPNIVILFADGDLGCYGHPTINTPHIDGLAAEGIRFTQWYSGFHVCSPSRSSMMTGRIPFRAGCAGASWQGGVFNSDAVGGLPLNETTIADVLKSAGYSTAAVGKWHLGQQKQYLPTSRGFDEYLGIPYSVDMGPSAWDRYGTKDRPPLPLLHGTVVVEQPTDLNLLEQRYTDFALSFMGNATQEGRPFLLYYAFNHVHVPDFATATMCDTSLRGRFGDAVESLDRQVGFLMDGLKGLGPKVEENTIVWFTSDNGPWLTKGLYGGSAGLLKDGKTTTWEGGVREPGIVRWKGKIQPRVSAAVVATYDIFSTSVSLAGAAAPADRHYDGIVLSTLLFANSMSTSTSTSTGGAIFATSSSSNFAYGGLRSAPGTTLAAGSVARAGHVNNTRCIFIYKGSSGLNNGEPCTDPALKGCPGLWAVRCGAHKMHWVTKDWNQNTPVFHDPPLLFHLEHDPGEAYPLKASSSEYKQASTVITAAKTEHEAGLTTGKISPNEMAKGLNPALMICGCPDSQKKNPSLPNCTCNPENFAKSKVACDPGAGVEMVMGFDGRQEQVQQQAFDEMDYNTWPMQEHVLHQEA